VLPDIFFIKKVILGHIWPGFILIESYELDP